MRRLDPQRWSALMARLGLPPSPDMFAQLDIAHARRGRHYHTAGHIRACLRHLDEWRDLAERPDWIEIAIWFHDAVYKPMSKTNEADSAAMAHDFLQGRLSDAAVETVTTMIELTRDHGETARSDIALMLDIDLSILAAPPPVYETYANRIRREYRFVPGPVYRAGRAKVLRRFLAMPSIYKTAELAAVWDASARRNLATELVTLE